MSTYSISGLTKISGLRKVSVLFVECCATFHYFALKIDIHKCNHIYLINCVFCFSTMQTTIDGCSLHKFEMFAAQHIQQSLLVDACT